MMTTPKNDDLFEDDFLSAMRALENPADLDSKNPHKQINLEKDRETAARSGNPEACKALGIHLCNECHGSGRYRGVRVHQEKAHCFACRGRGYFMRSYADRMADAQKAAAKKVAAVTRIRSELNVRSPELTGWMADNAHWCTLAASLLDQIERGKEPTDRQVEAIIGIRAKSDLRQAQRKAAAKAAQVEVDLTPIRKMFETAIAKGAKNPSYRAEGLIISQAKSHSVNAGMLYVVNDSKIYGGKLDGVIFKPTRDGQASDFANNRTAAAALAVIAEDPLAAAVRHGRLTGYCSCCGRLLVNDSKPDTDGLTSVERGIGPVCGRKMGLIH